MHVWTELDRATTATGDEILLRRRGALHEIRFNGIELMSSLMWRSEAVLAELAAKVTRHLPDARIGSATLAGKGTLARALAALSGLILRFSTC